MLSIIIPYWNRNELLNKTLDSFEIYEDLEFEVIVVDDGSPEPPSIAPHGFPIEIVSLPQKTDLKNPCLPWNTGVKRSKYDTVVLTHAEIRHEKPVFPKMIEELKERGERGYVLASCWDVSGRWYCYPNYKGPKADRIPEGFGLNFCAMMNKAFFKEIGGFDEIYRDGAGYEDNDFAWTIHKNGGNVIIRPDLVVNHYRTNVNWGAKRFNRNKRIFHEKWAEYWNGVA